MKVDRRNTETNASDLTKHSAAAVTNFKAPQKSVWQSLTSHPWSRQACLRCLPWLLSLTSPFSPRLFGHTMTRREIGLCGELLAARWLRKNQRKILYRNHRGPRRGEVDIVARHGTVLTFVEVKTRTSSAHGRPADAVNRAKQRLIERGAQDWLRLLGKPRISFRFDIVEVLLITGQAPHFHVVENAFTLSDSTLTGR